MEITSIPIVDFYKYCLESAQNRGYNWVVTLVARDADSMDLYRNLMKSWRSINSITAEHILFVFAGKENHAVGDDASCISDYRHSWRRIRNQFITFLNPHADLKTTLPNPDSYVPYNWHADKYGYLERIRENHTDATGPLKEYFNLCEADIPCLVFTSLRANRQHIVPVSNSANDPYQFFKKLITTIEPLLMKLRSLDSDYKDFFLRQRNLEKQEGQYRQQLQQTKSKEEIIWELYNALTEYATCNQLDELMYCIKDRKYLSLSQPYRGLLSKYIDLSKAYEANSKTTFDIAQIETLAAVSANNRIAVSNELVKVSAELAEISQKLPDIKRQIDATISQIDTLIANSVMTECIHRSSLQSRAPMGRDELLSEISLYLAVFSKRLELLNKNGLTDLNHSLEQTYCGLLNLVFDWNLQNMNVIRMNFPGIDLATNDGKICVQISSDASLEKIRKTLSVFFNGADCAKCEELYIFFTKAYTPRATNFDEYLPCGFVFNLQSHVWDTTKLFKRISTLDTGKLKAITEHLSKECGF